jgi:hypothetical protein
LCRYLSSACRLKPHLLDEQYGRIAFAANR